MRLKAGNWDSDTGIRWKLLKEHQEFVGKGPSPLCCACMHVKSVSSLDFLCTYHLLTYQFFPRKEVSEHVSLQTSKVMESKSKYNKRRSSIQKLYLGGGFIGLKCSSLLGEDSHFD